MQHQCNRYCRFFDLPTDYGNWIARKTGESDAEGREADDEDEDEGLYASRSAPVPADSLHHSHGVAGTSNEGVELEPEGDANA